MPQYVVSGAGTSDVLITKDSTYTNLVLTENVTYAASGNGLVRFLFLQQTNNPSQLNMEYPYTGASTSFTGTYVLQQGTMRRWSTTGAAGSLGTPTKVRLYEYGDDTNGNLRYAAFLDMRHTGVVNLPIVETFVAGAAIATNTYGAQRVIRYGGDRWNDKLSVADATNYMGKFVLYNASLVAAPDYAPGLNKLSYLGATFKNQGAGAGNANAILLGPFGNLVLPSAGTYTFSSKRRINVLANGTYTPATGTPAAPSGTGIDRYAQIYAQDDAVAVVQMDAGSPATMLGVGAAAGKTLTLQGSLAEVGLCAMHPNSTTVVDLVLAASRQLHVMRGATMRLGSSFNANDNKVMYVMDGTLEVSHANHLTPNSASTFVSISLFTRTSGSAVGSTSRLKFVGTAADVVGRVQLELDAGSSRYSVLSADGTKSINLSFYNMFVGTGQASGQLIVEGSANPSIQNTLDSLIDAGTSASTYKSVGIKKRGVASWVLSDATAIRAGGYRTFSGGALVQEGTLWLKSEKVNGCTSGTGTLSFDNITATKPVVRTAKGLNQKGRHTYNGPVILSSKGILRIGG